MRNIDNFSRRTLIKKTSSPFEKEGFKGNFLMILYTSTCHFREGGNPFIINSRLSGNDREKLL